MLALERPVLAEYQAHIIYIYIQILIKEAAWCSFKRDGSKGKGEL